MPTTETKKDGTNHFQKSLGIFPIKRTVELLFIQIFRSGYILKTDVTDLGLGFDFGFDLEEPPGHFLRIL